MIPNSVVEEVLKYYTWGCVIVDEAYIDFSGTESAFARSSSTKLNKLLCRNWRSWPKSIQFVLLEVEGDTVGPRGFIGFIGDFFRVT